MVAEWCRHRWIKVKLTTKKNDRLCCILPQEKSSRNLRLKFNTTSIQNNTTPVN